MADLPSRPEGNLPARRVSTHELEAIIRRAVELQSAGEDREEGITDAEVVRIGKELGLAPEVVRRAIVEVRSGPVEEHGVLARVMGPARVRAVRTIRGPAAEVGRRVEEYLLRREFMVVQRRYPDRTRYVRGSGVAAALGRATRGIGEKHPPLGVKALDVAVAAVDEGSTLVELSVEMDAPRGWLAGAGAGSGGALAALVGLFAWATPAPDLLAVAGLPALGATLWGSRLVFRRAARSTHERLESFLDRLEHGELRLPPGGPEWRKRLGI